MPFRFRFFFFLPKWQFGPMYFYNFLTYFFSKSIKMARTKMAIRSQKKGDRNDISVLMVFVKKKKSNHVGFIKIIFLIMVYKKNSWFSALAKGISHEGMY